MLVVMEWTKQEELFAGEASNDAPAVVPGFFLRRDYVSPEEEASLLSIIGAQANWDTDWKRRVLRYGVSYGPGKAAARAVAGPFPEWLVALARRVGEDAGLERFPENCVINEYLPAQGIAPHKDYAAFGAKVACVSLGSDIVLDFISEDRARRVAVYVPARSLWVIEGEARFKWLHGIAPRLHDVINGERRKRGRRVSITFRLKKDVLEK
jgi:alkylated DNA repair dioxygenase AlkB